jgi:hypothetical protein
LALSAASAALYHPHAHTTHPFSLCIHALRRSRAAVSASFCFI